MESAVNRIVHRWRREVDFELRLPDAAVSVLADELRIATAVENLVDNASKCSVRSSPKVSPVVLTARANGTPCNGVSSRSWSQDDSSAPGGLNHPRTPRPGPRRRTFAFAASPGGAGGPEGYPGYSRAHREA